MTRGRWSFWLALGAAVVAGRACGQLTPPQAQDTAGANSTAPSFAKATEGKATEGNAEEAKGENGIKAAYVWKSVAIVAGGYVPGIVFSPAKAGLIYCRTDIGDFTSGTRRRRRGSR